MTTPIIVKQGYCAREFMEHVDVFCFTDVRLDITPAHSLQLQEQLLRISDIVINIVVDYYNPDKTNTYEYIAIKAGRLSNRFTSIAKELDKKGIDLDPLMLFKYELAETLYEDCKALNDCDLYDALNSFLYKREKSRDSSRLTDHRSQ
jgi:hypothetical protein